MLRLLRNNLSKESKVLSTFIGVLTYTSVFFLSLPLKGLAVEKISLISDSPKEVIDQVWQIIYRDYLDSSGKYAVSDWMNLRRKLLSNKYIDKSSSYEAIRNMLETLEDPYTRFLDPKEFKEMKIETSGELTGVGIQLSLDKDTNRLIVVSPIEGTPAERSGVLSKDVIAFINGETTKGMSIERAVKLIRGKEGTKVKLGLLRNGQYINIEIIRERIEIKAVISKLNITEYGQRIGYIRLKQFNANASKEMRKAIKKLENKNVKGYVLDLRSNPGGLLEASIDISRQWINKGIIVSTQTRSGVKDLRRANGSALTSRPVVVLVNEGSASASEILSGAIRDNERGVLVGKKTFGKGLVQSVRGLSDGSGMTVTIAKYMTPNGTDIHKNGIVPDVNADMSEFEASNLTSTQLGTEKDSQYQVAETELIKAINKSSNSSSYDHLSTNIAFAVR